MTKKSWQKIVMAVISIIVVIAISLGTTLLVHDKIVPVVKVDNGLSAYEIAVQYGYEGTIEEWLKSLSGKSAYEIAVENGYSGTEKDWSEALEATSQNVASLKNAKFNSKGELILVLSDNTTLNVGVAVGKDGKDGEKGEPGTVGETGADGVGISTAKINDEGQLVIGL